MASVPINNAPSNFSLETFRSITDKYESIAKACRFAVRIRPTGEFLLNYSNFMQELTYLCESAEIPGRGFMNMDVRYYGPSQKLPFQSSYDDINMTFLCRNRSLERQFFDDWMLIINPVNTYDFNYRDQYRAEIDIYQYSTIGTKEHSAQYWITLHNAYPLLISPQPVTWADDQIQKVVVSFTYTHWTRKGLDPEPRYGEPGGFSFSLVEGRQVVR